MKVMLFTAALMCAASVNAIQLESQDIDTMTDFEFAELFGESEGKGFAEADLDIDAEADAEACEENVNGVTIRLQTPECKAAEPPAEIAFSDQMLKALQEQSSKSMELHNALRASFAANNKLLEGKLMDVTGTILIKPKINDGVSVPVVSPAQALPKENGATIKIVTDPATPAADAPPIYPKTA